MQVKKAWQFLLVNDQLGYYTGYKGPEMFGELDRAKVYRPHGEAHMAALGIKHPLEVESVLIWHRTQQDNEITDNVNPKSTSNPLRNHLRVVSSNSFSE